MCGWVGASLIDAFVCVRPDSCACVCVCRAMHLGQFGADYTYMPGCSDVHVCLLASCARIEKMRARVCGTS